MALSEFLKQFLVDGCVIASGVGKVLVGWGEVTRFSERPKGKVAFYFPDFFLEDPAPWMTYSMTEEMPVEELVQRLGSNNSRMSLCWEPPDRGHFESTFADLQKRFQAGELIKAVPYVYETAKTAMTCEHIASLLIEVMHHIRDTPLMIYGTWNLQGGILGATPEKLFALEGDALYTEAIAGTCPRKGENSHLLRDAKERREHQLVIDGITDGLKDLGFATIGETTVLDLPHLCHLRTPISLKLTVEAITSVDGLWEEIVRMLHPTPALGAVPKEAGIQWLKGYAKKFPRGRYGAPAGFWDGERGRCDVSIRNIQWNGEGLKSYAGCGVIPQSDCSAEWSEIKLKLQSIKEMFCL